MKSPKGHTSNFYQLAMRKLVMKNTQKSLRVLSVLTCLALAALGTAAPSAMADNPAATEHQSWDGWNTHKFCVTPYAFGSYGQYGAWGYYTDGCTTRVWCPNSARACAVSSQSYINLERAGSGTPVTLNSRIRAFSRSGILYWYRDVSCSCASICVARYSVYIRGGESASVQCNGVHGSYNLRGRVVCALDLRSEF